jgi:photosystem II stability/assembly factor-like uncharacterized protein
MADGVNILVGTVGQGVMRSPDGGEVWQRAGINQGMHSDAIVRCLSNHPSRPQVVFAGTDRGLFKSENAGESWQRVESLLNEYCVWRISVHPDDPSVVFAGTGTPTPAAVFRSEDGGQTWRQLPVEVVAECEAVGIPRVTGIAVDPSEAQTVWVGLEVDGVRVSRDGGDTWTSVGDAIKNPDVHSVAVAAGTPKSVFVLVNNDVVISRDDGASWTPVGAREVFPWVYCRNIAVRPGVPETVFVAIGDATPGRTGTLMRSTDTGATWRQLDLPVAPNSAMWVVDVQPEDPALMFAASRYGYLYRSTDGGGEWTKLWREFSEVSSILWTPN